MLSGVTTTLAYAFEILLFTGALFYLDWQLALVAMVAAPVFLLAARYFSARIKDASREQRRRSGSVTIASARYAWLQREVSGQAQFVATIAADKVCGLTVVQAILAAIIHRMKSGEGQHIEVPMFETMVAFNLVEHMAGVTFDSGHTESSSSRIRR